MKISVIIPTYRRPVLLIRCLNAIAHQDFASKAFEIIVVSDGFDSATARALRLWHSSFDHIILRYFSTSEKKGPAAARNLGWQKAEGDLIAFTDDDCIPESSWLTHLWLQFSTQTENEIAFSGKVVVPVSHDPTDYERNISNLERAEFITANCACTKNALRKVNGFDERFTMAWREDSDLQFKFIEQNIPICQVENAVVTHPVRRHHWTDYFRDEKKGLFNALLYKKYPELYKQKIQQRAPMMYYVMFLAIMTCVIALMLSTQWLFYIAASAWVVLTTMFVFKRLQNTSRKPSHVLEMIATSAIIPVLSLFWRWYGAWKFKIPLL